MKSIIIIALATCIWAALAAADPDCSPGTYEHGGVEEANVLTMLESMRTVTASLQNRYYAVHLATPDVFGYSSCNLTISVAECVSCLSTSVDEIRTKCGLAAAASNGQGNNCTVQFF